MTVIKSKRKFTPLQAITETQKLVRKYARGQISKADIDASLNSWAAHARRGNNHHVIKKMTQYYQTLWRDVNV